MIWSAMSCRGLAGLYFIRLTSLWKYKKLPNEKPKLHMRVQSVTCGLLWRVKWHTSNLQTLRTWGKQSGSLGQWNHPAVLESPLSSMPLPIQPVPENLRQAIREVWVSEIIQQYSNLHYPACRYAFNQSLRTWGKQSGKFGSVKSSSSTRISTIQHAASHSTSPWEPEASNQEVWVSEIIQQYSNLHYPACRFPFNQSLRTWGKQSGKFGSVKSSSSTRISTIQHAATHSTSPWEPEASNQEVWVSEIIQQYSNLHYPACRFPFNQSLRTWGKQSGSLGQWNHPAVLESPLSSMPLPIQPVPENLRQAIREVWVSEIIQQYSNLHYPACRFPFNQSLRTWGKQSEKFGSVKSSSSTRISAIQHAASHSTSPWEPEASNQEVWVSEIIQQYSNLHYPACRYAFNQSLRTWGKQSGKFGSVKSSSSTRISTIQHAASHSTSPWEPEASNQGSLGQWNHPAVLESPLCSMPLRIQPVQASKFQIMLYYAFGEIYLYNLIFCQFIFLNMFGLKHLQMTVYVYVNVNVRKKNGWLHLFYVHIQSKRL